MPEVTKMDSELHYRDENILYFGDKGKHILDKHHNVPPVFL